VAETAAGSYSGERAGDLAGVLADLLAMPAVTARIGLRPGMAASAAFKQLTSELTGRFATGAVAETRRAHGPGRLTRYRSGLKVPRLLAAEVAVLKAIAFHYVMSDPAHQVAMARQQELLAELVTRLADRGADALDPLYGELYDAADDDAARMRVVVDQVSLLTDAQAIARHAAWSR
jgi:dGTPase